ncbi:unnamed protein product [Zymoseptoria tritici ST99CH_3D7]|uniref:DUF6536 domain-containing protein n=1 Tax=Zymoseptoria tritici (strain ST99CH_3D7) TaxID=1276538 RepID=A0A1X7RNE3_ZYMT9|nr:unnamed protein product [Zymoseptoria tritici ST99CH_3D7]
MDNTWMDWLLSNAMFGLNYKSELALDPQPSLGPARPGHRRTAAMPVGLRIFASPRKRAEADELPLVQFGPTVTPNDSDHGSRDGSRNTAYQRFERRNSGWRMGVFAGLCTSLTVLCGNIILIFVGFRYSGYEDGIGILAQGRSDDIARISTAYHVLINILSTLILTSSNYCLQVLSSPSRQDVDIAHSEGSYVDIGVLSLRNVRRWRGWRKLGWYLLMLSSIPLHLFYNSAITEVTIGHTYTAHFVLPEDHWPPSWAPDANLVNLTTSEFIDTYHTRYIPDYGDVYITYDAIALYLNITETAVTLTNTQAMFPYNGESAHGPSWAAVKASTFASNGTRSDITTFPRFTGASVDFIDLDFPYSTLPDALEYLRMTGWADIDGRTGEVMLSTINPPMHVSLFTAMRLDDGSKVQIIMSFMLIVIACNVLKVAVMWFVWQQPHTECFITIGDSVQSFLRRPDRTTIGMCLESKESLTEILQEQHNRSTARVRILYQDRAAARRSKIRTATSSFVHFDVDATERRHLTLGLKMRKEKIKDRAPVAWKNSRRANFETVFAKSENRNWMRLMIGLLLFTTGTILTAVWIPIARMPMSAWGTASTLRMITGASSTSSTNVLFYTWIANAPQLAISVLYVAVNNYMTRLCSSHEWNRVSKSRKALRVTKPVAGQRSSHFLSLPYRWAVPLTVASGFMHWLLSQSAYSLPAWKHWTDEEIRDQTSRFAPVAILR